MGTGDPQPKAKGEAFWEWIGSTAFSVHQLLETDSWIEELEELREVPPAPTSPEVQRLLSETGDGVAVIDEPTTEIVEAIVAHRVPALFRGWGKKAGWEAPLQKWDLDFFEAGQLGELQVSLDVGEGVRRRSKMKDYVAQLKDGSHRGHYLRLWHYEEDCPEFISEFQIPDCFADGFNRLPAKTRPSRLPRWLFLGPEGTYTPLHTDPFGTHAWFLQLKGTKRFELWHPSDVKHLSDGTNFADLRDPDVEVAFPKALTVQRWTVDVEAGDLLFLPANWPHTVLTTKGPSISLTHNYLDKHGIRMVRTAFLMFTTSKIWRTTQKKVAEEKEVVDQNDAIEPTTHTADQDPASPWAAVRTSFTKNGSKEAFDQELLASPRFGESADADDRETAHPSSSDEVGGLQVVNPRCRDLLLGTTVPVSEEEHSMCYLC